MEFKKGQMVSDGQGIWFINKVVKDNVEGDSYSLKNGNKLMFAIEGDIKHLTRDEIIAHMQDNGWKKGIGYTALISAYKTLIIIDKTANNTYCAYIGDQLDPEVQVITQDVIDKMQEAHDYAQALNQAPE